IYPRFWIWRPSFERQRDFNPPEQRAAQRAVRTFRLFLLTRLAIGTGNVCATTEECQEFRLYALSFKIFKCCWKHRKSPTNSAAGQGGTEMKILKLCISRYSVLAALWMFLSATTYAQSSTRCTTTPDGAGASYTNCTTTSQPTDGSPQTQTQTNCTNTYDGSGGSFKNCSSNTTTTAPPAGGRLMGIAEVAAHPRPMSPTSPASQSAPSITTTTAPPAGGRLMGIAEVAAHPRPMSPTSP